VTQPKTQHVVPLSAHQRSALAALVRGPRRASDLALDLRIEVYATLKMLRLLSDRGLVRMHGQRGAMRQVPRRYTCELTDLGRAVAEEQAA
jgi:DNA-binding MarR family transcriptional regulator